MKSAEISFINNKLKEGLVYLSYANLVWNLVFIYLSKLLSIFSTWILKFFEDKVGLES